MRILALSDVHSDWRRFEPSALPNADLALYAGDLTNNGVHERSDAMLLARRWLILMGSRYPLVLWVPGNHDLGIVASTFGSIPNVECLLNRTIYLDWLDGKGHRKNISIHGVSSCPAFKRPDLCDQFEYMARTPAEDDAAFAFEPVDIVLSHCPPFGRRDRWPGDEYHHAQRLGSPALARYVEKYKPSMVVCGHVHEDSGFARLGRVSVHNVACRWELLHLPDDNSMKWQDSHECIRSRS